ncbi:MAG: iron-regulated protein [Bacteroidetes bacterium HGW-Bacteroidetes-1]|jgi:uncharacterized iron-regulated protein|nr:MAG: iron-regulated protein [Bacteroidetes bacterium HGW-Bacteroidetes-1]
MKYYKASLLISLLIVFSAFRSDKPAYLLFNQKGKVVKYKKLIESAQKADIIFFGELHDNPIAHWLQYDLTLDLFHQRGGTIVLGAEMFETDNQEALNAYLNDELNSDSLKKVARLWPNFKTDYKPLLDFAKTEKLPFIATNIPRSYASLVFRNGFSVLDTLSDAIKAFIAPLPVSYDPELPGYKNMIEMMNGESHGFDIENLPKAQAIKDATMAWFIYRNLQPGKLFIHYNGTYHSDNFEGIIWYLNLLKPDLKIVTISSIESEQPITIPEDKIGVAHFVVAVPTTMTKTY